MGAEHTFKQLSQFLAGRWQVPLALAATVVGSVTLFRLMPSPPQADFDALLADVAVLEQAGDTLAAADAVANLLRREPPLPPAQQAGLHSLLAKLIHRAECGRWDHNLRNVEQILEHDRAAAELGYPPSPDSMLRGAQAHQWLGKDDQALRGFRAVLAQELSTDQRRTTVRAVAELLEERPEAKLERRQMLRLLLSDESISPAYLWWALQHGVRDALDENDTLRAAELLARHGERLKSSDLKGYLEYLRAWIMIHEGRPEEAAPVARWIDEWLGEDARSTRELDDFGHLRSLNRWLMGRIHLAEDRPQEALAEFEDALEGQPKPDLRLAATVGRGLALGVLDRHQAAREVLHAALDEFGPASGRRRQAALEFQRTVLDLFEQRRAREDYPNALAYLALAVELTPADQPKRQLELLEKLGQVGREAAQHTDDDALARGYHEQAGRSLERAANLVQYDEPRLAELLWSAGEEYDRAGRLGDVQRTLQRFVQGRADHPRMPRALLQLGQAHEGDDDPDQALAWYARVIREYPRLEEAARAQLHRARLLVWLGPEHYAEAERSLSSLLASDYITPQADVYRGALLTLCELLCHQGRYAEAIGRLEDFRALYPTDPERWRAGFMLADAYRCSAAALQDGPPSRASRQAAAESKARFRTAAELFDRLLREREAAAEADEALDLYARLALFYRGDCLFELNEPEALKAALATYRNAAARYEGQPAALTAHVQIANVHLRLGEVNEAARALEQARWLLRSIPDEAFTHSAAGDRAAWERFLSVVLSSGLFRDAFAAAR